MKGLDALPIFANCRMAELENIILPSLFSDGEGRGELVRPTSKGYAITRRGLIELDRRGIHHQGDNVTAEALAGA